MTLSEADLADLKNRYAKLYGKLLTDEEAKELAQRLLTLFSVIGKKVPENKS